MGSEETVATGSANFAPDVEIQRLAEDLYRERVLLARKMPPEEKLLAGEELFDYACSITLAGIARQFPEANDEERLTILKERLQLRERMERRG